MVNLEQIKADIAARKAMPAWGANTSIERIKTINATLPSFSLKTVEALVERIAELEGALEVSQGDLSDTEDAMHLWAERARKPSPSWSPAPSPSSHSVRLLLMPI